VNNAGLSNSLFLLDLEEDSRSCYSRISGIFLCTAEIAPMHPATKGALNVNRLPMRLLRSDPAYFARSMALLD